MGRRLWHVAAALAPLPLIGLGYASIPGNQLAYRMELLFSGNGSVHALSRDAGATEPQPLPKAAASLGVPCGLEISQSGRGAHVWTFFTSPVPAADARAMGTACIHRAMALRGSMPRKTAG